MTACPDKQQVDDEEEPNYKIGMWAGTVQTQSRLVLRDEPQYWCAAWKIESTNVRLEEFQDGSLKGNLDVNLFVWSVHDSTLLEFEEITAGQWHKFTTFKLELTGWMNDDGYKLEVVELPESLDDPEDPTNQIQFWDFLFPTVIEGEWIQGEKVLMVGDSIRPQGLDYKETSTQANFREFSIIYTWEIRKL